MESDRGSEVIQLELKYCERCGGLWLRRLGDAEVFCTPCRVAAPEHAIGRRVRTRPRLPVNRNGGIHGNAAGLFCVQGGRA